ncbi:MAG: tRNA pseudouridine(13) synthase TruD [Candidatus Thermoplasmatota archaeon]|nr:tRNA pseudouridine(13) synthase TruD [Candidatus Thermoplasmatota archaeon]
MERKAGLELFFTDTSGIGGKLKKYPEDFRVDEEIDLFDETEGEYTIAKVWARNRETNRLLKRMANELDIPRGDIAFAGTKDKRAITTQWMSFKVSKQKLEEMNIQDVEIKDMFTSHRSLQIGAHTRNSFEVLIRDMKVEKDKALERADRTGKEIKEKGGFPNWFGVQRFGTVRPVTHVVGKKITEGDFKGAVETYVADPQEGENEECYEARKFLEDTWNWEEALEKYPPVLTFEKRIIGHLKDDTEDYVGALKRLPHNLLMMFVHSYQSYLFNRMVSLRLKRDLPLNDALLGDVILPTDKKGLPNKNTKVEVGERNLTKASKMVRQGKAFVSAPLYGHKSELSKGEQGDIERKIIEEEDVEKDDFIIPEISSISSTGTKRSIFAPVKDFDWGLQSEALKLNFSLNKGTYATTLLREFMKHPPEKANLYS